MPALHIRNRNDLIKYVVDHAPYKAIERALLEGEVENYGAFEEILATDFPGWIIKVKSKSGREWFLTISPKTEEVIVIKEVPWNGWMGNHRPENPLYAGDNPEIYRKEREDVKTEEH